MAPVISLTLPEDGTGRLAWAKQWAKRQATLIVSYGFLATRKP